MKSLLLRARLVLPFVLLGSIGVSQCPAPTWSSANPPIIPAAVASIVWDFDGAGPAQPVLVIGGAPTINSGPPNNVVTWDGTRFQAMAGISGISPSIDAFVNYNGVLVAACNFYAMNGISANSIFQWTGSTWQTLGGIFNGKINAMAVYNGALIATGTFTTVGGVPANYIAQWNGTSWQAMGPGLDSKGASLAVYGGNLVIGGEFAVAGGLAANRIATWNGSTWGTLGSAMSHAPAPPTVAALHVWGSLLIAGGNFPMADAATCNGIARWDGTSWQSMGTGVLGGNGGPMVRSLATYQGDLIAGGSFTTMNGVACNSVARWNGTSWQAVDGGLGTMGYAYTLTLFNSSLYACGGMGATGGLGGARSIVRFDGTQWLPLGNDVSGAVHSLKVHDGELMMAGWLSGTGPNSSFRTVRGWNGSTWRNLGLGFNDQIFTLGNYNAALVAAGPFTQASDGTPMGGVALWNGASWVPLGSGTNSSVNAVTTYNGELIAGGPFTTAGGNPANHIARWNGTTWQPLGAGVDAAVEALAVYQGELYAGGQFTTAGGVVAKGLARWNGATWQALGGNYVAASHVWSFAEFNGDLIAAGFFTNANNIPITNIGRWNGTTWQPMGTMIPWIQSKTTGIAVYGGELVASLNTGAYRWDGTSWQLLGDQSLGHLFAVDAMAVYAGELFVGGGFVSPSNAAGLRSPYLAKYGSPLPRIAFSQPQGTGPSLQLTDTRLIPGHQYFNVFSLDLAPGGVGTGAYGGLHFNDVGFLLYQASQPIGSLPFHFVAWADEIGFGPYPVPAGLTFDAISVDFTGGLVGCIAPAVRYTVQ